MTLIIPFRSAVSVPGRSLSQISAMRQRGMRLGSATMSFAPFCTALVTCLPIIG